jgi:aspartate/tyrosine/aromatic aminotransferase
MNYCDDIGALLVSTRERSTLERIKAHLFVINRGLFSFSSIYGSRIISRILLDEKLKGEWLRELQETWKNLREKREAILSALTKENVQQVDFLKKQKGIYMFFDLNYSQVMYLGDKYSIFVVPGGRISISSLAADKIEYFAKAIKDTLNQN